MVSLPCCRMLTNGFWYLYFIRESKKKLSCLSWILEWLVNYQQGKTGEMPTLLPGQSFFPPALSKPFNLYICTYPYWNITTHPEIQMCYLVLQLALQEICGWGTKTKIQKLKNRHIKYDVHEQNFEYEGDVFSPCTSFAPMQNKGVECYNLKGFSMF